MRSGKDGLAKLALSETPSRMVLALRGDDSAFLPELRSLRARDGGFVKVERRDSLAWYVVSDRTVYRPGERVRVTGWVRRLGGGVGGDVAAVAGKGAVLDYTLRDANDDEVRKGELVARRSGGFAFSVELPETIALGPASLELRVRGAESDRGSLGLRVEQLPRPGFEVNARPSQGPFFAGQSATVTAEAKYSAGGPVARAYTNWAVHASPVQWRPPNRDEFRFGLAPERVGEDDRFDALQTYEALTDASGHQRLRIDLHGGRSAQAEVVTAEVSVTDVERRDVMADADLLVHPAANYVGLRTDRTFVHEGEPLTVESIVTDVDGALLAGRAIQLRAVRLDSEQAGEPPADRALDAEDCAMTSAAVPVRCTFHPKQAGVYRIRASVHDEKGRENVTRVTRWVVGSGLSSAAGQLKLVPIKPSFAPGEQAELLVLAPFAPAEGILTLRRSGLVRTERFRMEGRSQTLRIPIAAGYAPKVHLQVDLLQAAARVTDAHEANPEVPLHPAMARAELNLEVALRERTLSLEVDARDRALPPGHSTTLSVRVRGARGEPVAGAEVAVMVVKEAVLALHDDRVPDPVNVFYRTREPGVSDTRSRDLRLGAVPMSGYVGDEADDEREMAGAKLVRSLTAAQLRDEFSALPLFAPSLTTDARGRIALPLKLPDEPARYRVIAIAAEGARRFGRGESVLTARLPLTVRPSAPRFLNVGDRFELPVVLQNQTDRALQVDVAVRGSNAEPAAGLGKRVMLPAMGRVALRFPAAARLPGTARFQFVAAAGSFSAVAELALPVSTPTTTETFASYGALDQGAITQPIRAPSAVWPEFGGLELTTSSSTPLQALTDAVLYLTRDPFESSEQLASRILSIAALKEVLAAFKAQGLPPPDEVLAAVQRDIETLQTLQNGDGGFGFWPDAPSWPWLAIHATHALARAQQTGFAVSPQSIERAGRYLREIERHIPAWYSDDARRTVIAYALAVRKRLGECDVARARAMLAESGGAGKLNLEALGFVYETLSGDPTSLAELEAIRNQLAHRVQQSAGEAHFSTAYTDGAHVLLHSARRVDGILLEALIADQPKSDLIPKLGAGLLAHRTAGHFASTQESAFVLPALARYFATYENATPDFVARVWLGPVFAGEQRYAGRMTDRQQLEVPMAYLAHETEPALTLEKHGTGRLYYRIGMRYAPRDLALPAAEHGFSVARSYEPLEKAADVQRDPDGTWHIRAGAKVRVRVSLITAKRRYHVALVDPTPAGFEAVTSALEGFERARLRRSIESPLARKALGAGSSDWYERQALHDDRAEAFASLLEPGDYVYSYVARATTLGSFAVPPSRAEEMYQSETFGHGALDRVVVED